MIKIPDNFGIPDGYEAEDPSQAFRDVGMSEEAIAELEAEIAKGMEEALKDVELTPEEQALWDIIESDTATEEEKNKARRELDPDLYDENGNAVLDDSKYFKRIEEALAELNKGLTK